MAKQVITIRCPICGWHHVPIKKGSKRLLRGEAVDGQERVFTFEKINLEKDAFLSVRLAGGRGKGFREIGKIRLQEAIEKNLYPELIMGLKNQCQKILEIIG
jgi:hypothetical protein